MIRIVLALVVALGLLSPLSAQVLPGASGQAEVAQPVAPPSPNDVREFLRLLGDESIQAWLRDNAVSPETPDAGRAAQSPRDLAEAAAAALHARGEALTRAVDVLPALPGILLAEWRDRLSAADKVRAVTLLLIFIAVGAGLEWLYRQTVQYTLLRLENAPQSGPVGRTVTAMQRAALIFAGLVIFAAGSIGTFVAFDWPPLVRALLLDLMVLLLIFRLAMTVSLFFQAPFAPSLRLVPWNTAMARFLHRMLLVAVLALLLAFATFFFFDRISEFDQSGQDMAAALDAAALVLAAAVLLVGFALVLWGGQRLPQLASDPGAINRRGWRAWQVYLMVVMLLAFVAWVFGTRGLMSGILVFGPMILILRGVRAWVDHFFDQSTEALKARHRADFETSLEAFRKMADTIEDPEERASLVEPEMPEYPDPYTVSRPIVQRALRFVLIISAILLFAALWGVRLDSVGAGNSLLANVLDVLFDSIVVLLLADLVWTWARVVIDKRLQDYRPPEDGSAPGPDARMITLLPLFRTTILVAVLLMVALSILTSLGVNIAPLLAGAGILGIAIGFGTQSLVRDIVSGLFFLIDDAFRVGEYIEVGNLMGSVESISVRSMRIRHHRGKVHTVPYGELKSVTNHSRDWVIMKLEFRVPFDTDLQLVKKLVKKVGAELKENDFYGSSILSTLKSQGVRRMEEFNMVVGVKFMTKPGEQWLVRRDAYQKVRDAFEKNGIRLAERNVKVEIDRDPATLTEEERNAVAAAAQQAAQAPDGPPKPVPDEP